MRIKYGVWILLYGLLAASPAIAGTYKWVDEDGNVVYSQNPPPKGKYESIRVRPAPRNNSSADSADSQSKKFLEESTAQRKNDAKVKAELEKSLAIRKKNCETAKKQLEFYTVYGRKKNDKGEYVRITEKEKQAGLKEAKQAIKNFCN